MSPERLGIAAILAFAAMIALYYATSNTDGSTIPVPEVQTEAQFFGLNVGAKTQASLIMPEVHFWAPGWSNGNTGETVKTCPHRYPVVSGGNISTIMHKGWSDFSKLTPSNSDWFLNPPEVAVI